MKLRDLPKNQMLIAEKLINDTLFKGCLTLTHIVNNEATQHCYYSPETFRPMPGELN